MVCYEMFRGFARFAIRLLPSTIIDDSFFGVRTYRSLLFMFIAIK